MSEARTSPPLISVITAAYNRPDYLRQALFSIEAQTYRPVELVIVDDGSTDPIEPVVHEFKNTTDFQILYVRQGNAGPGAARNHGFNKSTGKYIAFLDSDDLWFPEMLAVTCECLEKYPEYSLACGGWDMVSEADTAQTPFSGGFMPSGLQKKCDADFFKQELLGNLFPIHAVLTRRSAFDRTGPFRTDLEALEDWDLWLRLSANRNRIRFIDVPVARWRMHSCMRRSQQGWAHLKSMPKIFQALFDDARIRKEYAHMVHHPEIHSWLNRAHYCRCNGIEEEVPACIEKAGALLREAPDNVEMMLCHLNVLAELAGAGMLYAEIRRRVGTRAYRQWMSSRYRASFRAHRQKGHLLAALADAFKSVALAPDLFIRQWRELPGFVSMIRTGK